MKVSLRLLHITASSEDVLKAREALKKAGLAAEMLQVKTPDQLSDALNRGPWDAALAVHSLTGFRVPAGLAALAATGADLPYILFTKPLGDEAVAAAFRAGAADYVRRDKPAELVTAVRRQLRLARARRKRREEEAEFERIARGYRALFDGASDAIFITDLQGRILNVNKAACVRLGYTRLELLRKSLSDIDEEDRGAIESDMVERIKRVGQVAFERVHRAKSGARLPVEVNARIIDYGGRKAVLGVARDIRERKLAEEALRISENKLSEAMQLARLGHWEYDVASDRFTFNDNFYAVFRTTAQAVGGYAMSSREYVRRFVFPGDYRLVNDEAKRALEATDPLSSRTFEHRIVYADGEVGCIQVRAFAVKDENGNTVKTYGVNEDVTERRRAEEALRESDERFRRMFQYSAAGIVLVGPDFRFQRANEAFCRMLRYSERELQAKTFQDVTHPDDRLFGERVVRETLDGAREAFQLEERYLRRDGAVVWGLVSSALLRDASGAPLYFVTQIQDITERKRAEEALRESEERYRGIVENSLMGIGISSGNRVLFANDALLALFGYERLEEMLAVPLLDLVAPSHRALIEERMAKLARGEPVPAVYEYDILCRDGSAKTLLASSSHSGSGGAVVAYTIFQDVTERKRAAEALATSELKYNRLFAEIADGCSLCRIVYDGQGRPLDYVTLEINAAFERMLGVTRAGVIGRPASEILPPAELRSWLSLFAPIAVNGGSSVYEHYSPSNRKHFEGSVFSIEKDVFVVVFRDITDRKRAEETLRLREAQLVNAMKIAELGDWEYDVATDVFTFNDNFYAIFGTTAEKVGGYTMRAGEYADRFLHPDDRALVRIETEKALATNDPNYSRALSHRIIQDDGSVGYIAVRIFIVKDKDGKTVKTYGVNQNITRQKKAEEALRRVSARYRAILSSVPDIIMETDRDKIYTWANDAGRQFFGEDVIGREAAYYFEGEQDTYEKVEPLYKGGEDTIYAESWQRRRDGQRRLLAWWCRALKDDSGQVGGALSTARDITERKLTEESLQWELSVNTALAELSAPLISPETTVAGISRVILDRALQLTVSAIGFVAFIDPTTGECLIQSSDVLQSDAGRPAALERAPDGSYPGLLGHALNTRTPFFTNDLARHRAFTEPALGHVPLERFLAVPVLLGTDLVGQIALANSRAGYTDRDLAAVRRLADFFALAVQNKRADERVKSSLKEKTILLKEIHHRIKNNLQVVMSLLNLQAYHLTDARAQALFRENQLRIRSMALVHERLYQSSDLSRVDFREYITKLAVDLFRAYRIDANTVKLTVTAEDVTLGIDASVPCGLIINELLLNSLKHAFPRGRRGRITVKLERYGDDRLLMTVADDGVGLNKNVDLYGSKSLGFSLVVALAEQLGGAIKVSREPGTKIEILFKAKE
jgi:PAS domain S-box-containing protein